MGKEPKRPAADDDEDGDGKKKRTCGNCKQPGNNIISFLIVEVPFCFCVQFVL